MDTVNEGRQEGEADVEEDDEGLDGVHRRRPSKRISIVIDENDKIWAPASRKTSPQSQKSGRTSDVAMTTIRTSITAGQVEEIQVQEVHLGHSSDIRRKSLTYLKKELEIDYHIVPLQTLYNRLGSHPVLGLDRDQVARNAEKYGVNELKPPKKTPNWLKFLKTLVGGFQLLLWTGSILCYTAYIAQAIQSSTPPPDNLYLGTVLALLVLVLGCFTFYQEYSSGKVMESFSKMVPNYATVIRDGNLEIVDAKELVVGDICEVSFGDQVPADIRIIEANGFKVDNSSLTGESDPQVRVDYVTSDNPMETKNLAFFSTNALEGTAKGIVVSVGDNTFIGRIAGLTSILDSCNTPLARELNLFVKLITSVAVFFGVTFFIVSLSMGYSWMDAVLFLIGIIVANVPEGLLVTFTAILALTAKRMAGKNCLVRQLHAVETLGSTTVICSDKTGTLTQNRMTCSHFWYNNFVYSTEASTRAEYSTEDPGWKALTRVAMLCSRARFAETRDNHNLPVHQRKIYGDASESAILRCMEELEGNVKGYQTSHKKLFEIPFNSANKWQLSVHEMAGTGMVINGQENFLLVMKGAPEKILTFCKKILIGDQEFPIDAKWTEATTRICNELASHGERVLGFCDALLPADQFPAEYWKDLDPMDLNPEIIKSIGLRLVGLISMIDPPRPGVPDAVQCCRSAGIKVVMVTGDHPATARAIARSVGIISEGNETLEERATRLKVDPYDIDPADISTIVVHGEDLLEFSTERLADVLQDHKEIVFARVSPQQKLVIVEGFQKQGQVVAVTGDGVNDAPALKKADIGIAMGISGSDVSKQAADMVLLDDNFTSIVSGVEEGRLIFENLSKCIRYLLTANWPELSPFLMVIILRIPLPLGTIPMLMICLGTDIVPTIALGYEKAEGDIMKRPPRNNKERLVTPRLVAYAYAQLGSIELFAGFLAYFVIMGQNGFRPDILIGLQDQWNNPVNNAVIDSYGQEWTYYNRKQLERTCWTAYFCNMVVCQWSNVLITKVKRMALFPKLFDNWVIILSIVIETALACLLTYTPVLNVSISYMPIKPEWWLPAVPFALFMLIYDELRRLLLRNYKSPWFQKEFYC